MLTIVCQEPGLLRAEQREKPSRRPGETLVRIERVGVCGTDLHIFSGNQPYLNYPRVMGLCDALSVLWRLRGLPPGQDQLLHPHPGPGRAL